MTPPHHPDGGKGSKYAGHASIAVGDPDVRKMLMLYSGGHGRKMPLSTTTPLRRL
jgi:hypothetical protein